MDQLVLIAKLRKELGSSASRRLRREKIIPAVLYGQDKETHNLKIAFDEFDKIRKARKSEHAVIDLNIVDLNKKIHVIIKKVEHDHIKGDPIHIDFLSIAMNKEILTKVAIESTGEAAGVAEGGILDHPLWELEIKCFPKDIPDKIEVDVSGLNIGDMITVADLKLPQNVEVTTDSEHIVFSVIEHKEEVEEVKIEGEEEAAEPEVITAKKEEPGEEKAEDGEKK